MRYRRAPGAPPFPGQALVEFAIVLPVLVLLVGAVIQFGLLFWAQSTLNQVVRDAARYAATVSTCGMAGTADITTKTEQIEAQSSFPGTYGAITVTLPTPDSDKDALGNPICPPSSNAEVVWVALKVEATVPIFFPLIEDGHVESQATLRMEPRP